MSMFKRCLYVGVVVMENVFVAPPAPHPHPTHSGGRTMVMRRSNLLLGLWCFVGGIHLFAPRFAARTRGDWRAYLSR